MLLGGHGNVSVTANVAPRAMNELCVAALAGKAREAAAIHLKLLPLHKALFVEPSPAPTKWALARLGRCSAGLRLPITPLTAAGQAVVEKRDARSGAALTDRRRAAAFALNSFRLRRSQTGAPWRSHS